MKQSIARTEWAGYWFILPAAITLILLVTYPLIYGAYISFFNTNLVNKWDFVGLSHYLDIFSNWDFVTRIWLTLKYTFFTVAGHFVLGMGLALVLNMNLPGRTFFRAILILPWLLPEVVVGLLWKWLFNPMYGLFNHFLMKMNLISEPVSWLGDNTYAFMAIIIVCIWKGYPMVMMLLLAGLQSISQDMYEAAKIDGCNRFKSFRYVTLPSLMPVLMVTLILDTVWWFKHFTMIWILTQGGPGDATNVVSIDIFKNAFEFFDFGKAAAMAVVVFFVCFLIGFVYRRLFDNGND
ncbi:MULTISPECIES: carbohydrate ABC transporter permease [Paenibacillus]|uniref:Sugar ABC transporter permease n=1 Tax=Paenibacillus radicis (ex Xue et al. 2023) TaxID=2972489 RepID=A0ABT1YVD2_9BACL|nr:sugar ABC transporter permease [Paenibacillus radicis (ex Xue et al. 2023)]MCR8636905.1 sugar ABC transporter permease [Paenibacillus radicis (ex Xue et al. 2023)]